MIDAIVAFIAPARRRNRWSQASVRSTTQRNTPTSLPWDANLFTDWEVHGPQQGTNNTSKTPGQAFTDEWRVGQILPLKKNLSQLLQVGVVGCDQWQITDNGGTVSVGPIIAPAKFLPYYSVHGVGGQINYILPTRNFSLFFKYYHEYKSESHTLGTTIVFGGTWTLPIPKPPPPK